MGGASRGAARNPNVDPPVVATGLATGQEALGLGRLQRNPLSSFHAWSCGLGMGYTQRAWHEEREPRTLTPCNASLSTATRGAGERASREQTKMYFSLGFGIFVLNGGVLPVW